MNVLLKDARIVHPNSKDFHLKKRDILIKNGNIQKIASSITPQDSTRTLKLDNLHVSIGWFDSGVSFGEPGFEERETLENGLKTAAKSGFTDLVLNPNMHPLPDSSSDIVFLKDKSHKYSTILYPLGVLSVQSKGADLAEMYDMQKAGAVGFYDYKKPIENSNLLKVALLYSRNFKGLIYSFPLDKQIGKNGVVNEGVISTKLGLKGIPAMAEELQIARDLSILEYTGGKLHIPTISTAGSMDLIAAAKKKGLDVSCSVAIHNLWFTEEGVVNFDTHYKVLPALRTKADLKALIKGVKDGTIDMVTTDHTPIDIEEKRTDFDSAEYGTIGLESAFGVLNQLFNTEMAIKVLVRGRERFGIKTPRFEVGQKANLAMFNPTTDYEFGKSHIDSTSKNSLFLGTKMLGKAYGSISNNKLILN